MVSNLGVDLRNMGVSRVKCSQPVSLPYDRFTLIRQGFKTVANVACWSMMFSCGMEYVAETFFTGGVSCWR